METHSKNTGFGGLSRRRCLAIWNSAAWRASKGGKSENSIAWEAVTAGKSENSLAWGAPTGGKVKILSLGSPHGGKPPLAPLTDRNKLAVWAATPREAGWISPLHFEVPGGTNRCSTTIPCIPLIPPFQSAEGQNAAEEFGGISVQKSFNKPWKHQLISQHPCLLESQLLQFLLQKLKAWHWVSGERSFSITAHGWGISIGLRPNKWTARMDSFS